MAFCSTWNVNSHYKLIHSQSNFDGVVVECIHYIYIRYQHLKLVNEI